MFLSSSTHLNAAIHASSNTEAETIFIFLKCHVDKLLNMLEKMRHKIRMIQNKI
jgi:hypothetical protein